MRIMGIAADKKPKGVCHSAADFIAPIEIIVWIGIGFEIEE